MPRPRKKKEKNNKCPHCGNMFGGSGFLTHVRYCELKHRQQPPAQQNEPPKADPEKPPQPKETDPLNEDDTAKIIVWNELPQNKQPSTGWDKFGEAVGNAIEKAAGSEILQAILVPIIAGAVENHAADTKEHPEAPLLDPKDPKNDWILKANYFKE